jgi:hypothetical protein
MTNRYHPNHLYVQDEQQGSSLVDYTVLIMAISLVTFISIRYARHHVSDTFFFAQKNMADHGGGGMGKRPGQ